jgi:hypothetical protein
MDPSMYKLQLCLVQVPTATNQQPLPPLIPLNPFIMQQLLESQGDAGQHYALARGQHSNTVPEDGSGVSTSTSESVSSWTWIWLILSTEFGPKSTSDSTAQHRSTRNHPGHARIGVVDNTGVGKVWRIPSRNPSMVDHNSNPADADDEAIQQGSSITKSDKNIYKNI